LRYHGPKYKVVDAPGSTMRDPVQYAGKPFLRITNPIAVGPGGLDPRLATMSAASGTRRTPTELTVKGRRQSHGDKL